MKAFGDISADADAQLSSALARWTQMIQRLSVQGGRVALVSQIAAEARRLQFLDSK